MTEKFQDKYRIPSARLQNWDYSAEGIYFITICTEGHKCFFGKIINKKMILSEIGSLVQKEWEKSFDIRAELFCDYSVIMPNHIHAILRIENGKYVELHGRLETDEQVQTDQQVQTDARQVQTDGRPSLQRDIALQQNDPDFQQRDLALQQNNQAPERNATPLKFGMAYRPAKSISSFVAGFKSVVTVNARKIHAGFGWQTRFYDHIICNDPEYQRIANYITDNPVIWEQDTFYRNESIQ